MFFSAMAIFYYVKLIHDTARLWSGRLPSLVVWFGLVLLAPFPCTGTCPEAAGQAAQAVVQFFCMHCLASALWMGFITLIFICY